MKLLLKDKVEGLGDQGEVVDVSDGYGRNYLLPQRLAVPNTPENRRKLETDRMVYLQREAKRAERAKEASKALKNALLQVRMKAQKDGSLYGAVTSQVVCEVVERSRGFEIEERWVQLEHPIRKIGDYDIVLKLPGDLEVKFKLTVLPEDD